MSGSRGAGGTSGRKSKGVARSLISSYPTTPELPGMSPRAECSAAADSPLYMHTMP
jgi:hypothetical protein